MINCNAGYARLKKDLLINLMLIVTRGVLNIK